MSIIELLLMYLCFIAMGLAFLYCAKKFFNPKIIIYIYMQVIGFYICTGASLLFFYDNKNIYLSIAQFGFLIAFISAILFSLKLNKINKKESNL